MLRFVYFLLGLVAGLALAVLLGLGFTVLWKITLSPLDPPLAAAQASLPACSNVSDPLCSITLRVEKLESDQAFTMRDIAWKMDQRIYASAILAFVITTLVAFFGYRTNKEIDRMTQEKLEATSAQLDQALSKKSAEIQGLMDELAIQVAQKAQKATDAAIDRLDLDPGEISTMVQADRNLDKIWARLSLTGFKKLAWYSKMDASCTRGIVIVPIENQSDEETFRIFLENFRQQLDPARVAFILYAPNKGHMISGDTIQAYDNLVTANMPITAANMALLVMRGLKKS